MMPVTMLFQCYVPCLLQLGAVQRQAAGFVRCAAYKRWLDLRFRLTYQLLQQQAMCEGRQKVYTATLT